MNKCIIMSGGMAHRVRHLIGDRSKQMTMINGKPILEHCIIESIDAGCDNVLVVTDPRKKDQNDFLILMEEKYGIKTISLECNRLMESIKISKSFVGDDDFLMMLPDMITFGYVSKNIIVTYHKYQSAVISLYEENKKFDSGYWVDAHMAEDNIYDISGFSKEKISSFRVFGRYVFPKKTFSLINDLPTEDSEVSLLRLFSAKNMLLGLLIDGENIYDAGSTDGLEKIKNKFT